MQPKRFLTYRLHDGLGLTTGFNFGTRLCAARIEITHNGLGSMALSSMRLVTDGQDIPGTPRKTLVFALLRDLDPSEANATLWLELKEFWLRYGRDGLVTPPLKTETRWSIEDYAASRGLSGEETAILLRHAAEVTAIVDASGITEEDEDAC